MEAIITEIIGKQGFEIVKERILEILLLELSHQKEIQPELADFNLFMDRYTPIDQTESVLINLNLGDINFDNKGQETTQGTVNYYIDIYSKGVSTSTAHGDIDAAKKLLRYIGLCRYVLSSTKYNTLGFETQGLIGGTYIESIQPYSSNEPDASFVKMGRLVYVVKIQEDQELWNGIALEGTNTNLKLELTDKGYTYTLNQ